MRSGLLGDQVFEPLLPSYQQKTYYSEHKEPEY
jgi:hypothetical protein